ncbi:hypothetical protein SAMN05444422_101470 [Halobiforma haloterrestris]|uniref:Uncharacterized protein n=2 Tax=Natronobacterium haloterrestre TaxID=148448 RepID=A0A1I1DB48_NATHA|nr:hypothetical protein SAMN05444422_101470 [Halobiforma haloterrestris]
MWVYGYPQDKLKQEDNQRMKNLMIAVDYGDEEERVAVAEQLNRTLKSDSGYLFAYWNWRQGQEVEDYDDLVEYYKLYGKILANEVLASVRVCADHKEDEWFYIDHRAYELSDDDAVDVQEWHKRLDLKVQVQKGEQAKKRLEEFGANDGENDE